MYKPPLSCVVLLIFHLLPRYEDILILHGAGGKKLKKLKNQLFKMLSTYSFLLHQKFLLLF